MNATTDAAAELKPCPFCGNDGSGAIEDALHVVHTQNEGHMFYDCYSVQCDRCTGTMGYSESREDAIAAWNTRPPTDEAAVREAAARLVDDEAARIERLDPQSDIRLACAVKLRDAAAAIRQLDLPGGEEVERLRAPTLRQILDAVYSPLPRERLSCSDDESGTQLSLGRQRKWSADAVKALFEALTPARVERSGEGGGA